jgi:hypothetical protein
MAFLICLAKTCLRIASGRSVYLLIERYWEENHDMKKTKKRAIILLTTLGYTLMLTINPAIATKHSNNSVEVHFGLGNDRCTSCHANGYGTHWGESHHANYELAKDIAVASFTGKEPGDENCLPCHTAQGFIEWDKRKFESYYDFESSLVDPKLAHPQTCVTCHTPHDIGVPNGTKSQLRVDGDTMMLPAGFKAEDVGKGALCITCHNSKYDSHNDKVTKKMNHKASHEGTQGDVLMGENFFFVETGKPGAHAMIKDTCVACHMPDNEWKSGHNFKASVTDCSSCHSGMDGAKLQASINQKTEKLKKSIEMAILKILKTGLDNGELGFLNMTADEVEDTEWTRLTKGTVKAVNIRYFHGRQAIDLTIDNNKYLVFINVLEINGNNILDTEAGQIIARSGWNLIMINHDRSGGMHNPGLITKVLNTSLKKLESI